MINWSIQLVLWLVGVCGVCLSLERAIHSDERRLLCLFASALACLCLCTCDSAHENLSIFVFQSHVRVLPGVCCPVVSESVCSFAECSLSVSDSSFFGWICVCCLFRVSRSKALSVWASFCTFRLRLCLFLRVSRLSVLVFVCIVSVYVFLCLVYLCFLKVLCVWLSPSNDRDSSISIERLVLFWSGRHICAAARWRRDVHAVRVNKGCLFHRAIDRLINLHSFIPLIVNNLRY